MTSVFTPLTYLLRLSIPIRLLPPLSIPLHPLLPSILTHLLPPTRVRHLLLLLLRSKIIASQQELESGILVKRRTQEGRQQVSTLANIVRTVTVVDRQIPLHSQLVRRIVVRVHFMMAAVGPQFGVVIAPSEVVKHHHLEVRMSVEAPEVVSHAQRHQVREGDYVSCHHRTQ